jgi:hypothetical protein
MKLGQRVKLKEHNRYGVVVAKQILGNFFSIKWDNGTTTTNHRQTLTPID